MVLRSMVFMVFSLSALFLLFDGVSSPAHRARQDNGCGSAVGKKKGGESAGLDPRLKSGSQCLITGGSLPPFGTSFTGRRCRN
jgi:hypothetical protein